MREIGGYLEFEHYRGSLYHDEAFRLNFGRTCLEYLILTHDIKKIWFPKLICDSVVKKCASLGVEYAWYGVNKNLHIIKPDVGTSDWVYIINYYGQVGNKTVVELKNWHKNLIFDNAQAFFQEPVKGVPTIYTCRKYFGVPDGAFLYTETEYSRELDRDISYERMTHLLGRFERNGTEFYSSYSNNEDKIAEIPMKRMSKLTENLLRGIDYDYVALKRTNNWKHMHNRLKERNCLNINDTKGSFAYPFFTDNGRELRAKLIKKNIYIPILWPNVLEDSDVSSAEYEMAMNILPLPVDQRYSEREMDRVVEEVLQGLLE